MDLRSNEPYWLIKNAFVKSYPSLDESISTDILVIGGGITGALIAHKLLQEGKDVVLVDKRDVCNGSSAASTGMLQYEIDVPLHKLIEQRGLDCAVSGYKNCEKAIFDLKKIIDDIKSNCSFEFKKSIYFTPTRKGIKFIEKEFNTRKKYGFKVNWLEKEALMKLGLDAYAGIESASGAIIDPYKFSYDLLEYCSKKGMRIFDRTEIQEIKNENNKILAKTQNKISIQANHIIHCTGYESINTLRENIVDLKSTYALASEVFEEIPNTFKNHIYWDNSSPYFYFRKTSEGRLIMGGCDEQFKNATKRDSQISKKQKDLTKQFRKYFPSINFKPDYTWAGTFGETTDGLPYFGRPNQKTNEHYFLGFGGNGITYSVMAREAIMHSLNNTNHPFLNDYSFGR
ncbi:MAG: FAD-dependent oxidoreductase [Bacteroidales bacterium]|nr:FAD-dependent oxidoreductase [Bacteroidales bacterium]